MDKMDLDRSLAFTAGLELAPGMTVAEGQAWRDDLLAAWYAQSTVRNFWEFARQWAASREIATLTVNGDRTTLAELLHEFPSLTERDVRELRSGATDWQQASDREDFLYRIWWDRRAAGLIAIPV